MPRRVESGSTTAFTLMSSFGASFRFPLAPAEVRYLNGHRPFSLGGGNGWKVPHSGHSSADRVSTKSC